MFCRQLIENAMTPKHLRVPAVETTALVDLLVSKDEEFRSMLQLAAEQEKIEQKMNAYRAQVEIQVGDEWGIIGWV